MKENNQLNEHWDQRHNVAIRQWTSIESSLLDQSMSTRNIIRAAGTPTDRFDVDSLFIPGDTSTLIIAFHGALVRNETELPRFEWLHSLLSRNDNLLFFADTTLSVSDGLTLGWYIGSVEDDLTLKISNYIRHIVRLNGYKKVILLGSSGGGYAALSIATYIQNSCAIAFTPQTNVWEFSKGHTDNLMKFVFHEYSTPEEVSRIAPHRFSLVHRYKTLPWNNKFIYFQNLGDVDHHIKHKKPFAESLGVRLPNGRTFNQSGRFISENHGSGHVRPPKERLHPLIDQAIESLDQPAKIPLRSAGLTGNLLDHSFRRASNAFQNVPPELNSYYLSGEYPLRVTTPILGFTDGGVPLRIIDGHEYDHPVLQAQFMLKHLNFLRSSGSLEILGVMREIVRRVENYGLNSRNALYFPFKFEWNQGKQQPPWYSAMAQGQLLSAIIRLYELDPNPAYLALCERIFNSFINLPEGDLPWIADIDENGYLWFEEYPFPGQGKCVINGHLFAVWGLYDYWRVTGNSLALELANAGLLTTKRYISLSRNPGWSSHYDVNNYFLIRNYHQTHISQFEITYQLTGDPFFVQMADLLEEDFPSYQLGGTMYISSGEHHLAVADNSRVPSMVIEERTVVLEKAIAIKFDVRTKIESEEGIWLRISEGEFADHWIRELAKSAFPRVCLDKHYYRRSRRMMLLDGTYVHHRFNEWGSAVDKMSLKILDHSEFEVSAKALWNGVWYYEFGGSGLKSRWLRCDTGGLVIY